MYDADEKIRSILHEAEASLKAVIAGELEAGRFSQVARIAGIGDALSELVGSVHPSHASVSNKIANRADATLPKPVQRKARPAKSRRASITAHFPRFERDGERLVKVGWSKKRREEYEHRAPREVVETFARVLWVTARPGNTFTMETILPVHDSSGDELPSYQSYLSLAWLRSAGALEKRGRDGYDLVLPDMTSSTFAKLWNKLPQRA